MKILAWYTAAIMVVAQVATLIQLLEGVDIATSVWVLAFNTPILVFAILYIKNNR